MKSKVKQTEIKFRPVTIEIVLETQAELNDFAGSIDTMKDEYKRGIMKQLTDYGATPN